jgi:hypothetical protein
MEKIFSKLPLDIVRYIVLYCNNIKYRNGKLMGQIDKKDDRYLLLNNLSRIETIYLDSTILWYSRKLSNYTVDVRQIYIDDLYPEENNFDLHYQYLFKKNRLICDNSRTILYTHILR